MPGLFMHKQGRRGLGSLICCELCVTSAQGEQGLLGPGLRFAVAVLLLELQLQHILQSVKKATHLGLAKGPTLLAQSGTSSPCL